MTFADYDIQGRPHTVTDAQGTRTLSYAAGGILSGDSLTGIAYTHDNGRVSGLSLGSYAVTYGYDAATGRFNSLTYQPGTADEQVVYLRLSAEFKPPGKRERKFWSHDDAPV